MLNFKQNKSYHICQGLVKYSIHYYCMVYYIILKEVEKQNYKNKLIMITVKINNKPITYLKIWIHVNHKLAQRFNQAIINNQYQKKHEMEQENRIFIKIKVF